MEVIQLKEDKMWELVLQSLSAKGRLLRFQRLPRYELYAYLKTYKTLSTGDLRQVYKLVHESRLQELDDYFEFIGAGRVYSMLHNLVGCMKCWVETESSSTNLKSRWKVAHS